MSADDKSSSNADEPVMDEQQAAPQEERSVSDASSEAEPVRIEGNLFAGESSDKGSQAKLLTAPKEGKFTLLQDGTFTFEPSVAESLATGEMFSITLRYQFVDSNGQLVIREAVLTGTATDFELSPTEDIAQLESQLRLLLEKDPGIEISLTSPTGEVIDLVQLRQEINLARSQHQPFDFVEFSFTNPLASSVPVAELVELVRAGLVVLPGVELVDQSAETEAVQILSGPGDDIIVAGTGGDTVAYEVGQGSDTIDGGAGFDLVSVNLSAADDNADPLIPALPASVSISAVNGNVVLNGGDFALTLSGVEEILLTSGNAGGSFVIGDLTGTDIADDTIILLGGNGAVNVVNESNRSLEVRATPGNDTITGGSSTDLIVGLGGDDSLVGNAGNDTLGGGAGKDTLDGGAGDDLLDYTRGDVFRGGTGEDTLQVFSNSVDVAQLLSGGFSGIEIIEFVGERSEILTIDRDSAQTLLDQGQTSLRIDGRSEDTIFLGASDWSAGVKQGDFLVYSAMGLNGAPTGFSLQILNTNDQDTAQVVRTSQADLAKFPSLPTQPQNGAAAQFPQIPDPAAEFSDLIGLDNDLLQAGLAIALNNAPGAGQILGVIESFSKVSKAIEGFFDAFGGTTVYSAGTELGDRLSYGDAPENLFPDSVTAGAFAVALSDINGAIEGLVVDFAIGLATALVKSLVGGQHVAFGGAGNDSITGHSGTWADFLDGGRGADTLVGGKGDDVYLVDSSGDVVVESPGQGTDSVRLTSNTSYALAANVENLFNVGFGPVSGNDLNNYIEGNNSGNAIDGGGGNDTLNGQGGGDILNGQAGSDLLFGGEGNDAYIFDENDIIFENENAGTDSVFFTGFSTGGANGQGVDLAALEASGNLFGTIENIILQGQSLNFNAAGNYLNNFLQGNLGNNLIEGRDGNDTLIGGDQAVSGNHGTDTLEGGRGDDRYLVRNTNDVIFDSEGNDTIVTFSSAETIFGGNQNREIVGFSDATFTYTLPTDSVIENLVLGEIQINPDDAERFRVSFSNDVAPPNQDMNAVGGLGDNKITGSSGNNTLTARGASDTLIGGLGNDTLIGDSGADTAAGAAGDARLEGGLGNDFYQIQRAGDVIVELSDGGNDTATSNSVSISLLDYSSASLVEEGGRLKSIQVSSVENVLLTGSLNLNATGDDKDNFIQGNFGKNLLLGGGGNDTFQQDLDPVARVIGLLPEEIINYLRFTDADGKYNFDAVRTKIAAALPEGLSLPEGNAEDVLRSIAERAAVLAETDLVIENLTSVLRAEYFEVDFVLDGLPPQPFRLLVNDLLGLSNLPRSDDIFINVQDRIRTENGERTASKLDQIVDALPDELLNALLLSGDAFFSQTVMINRIYAALPADVELPIAGRSEPGGLVRDTIKTLSQIPREVVEALTPDIAADLFGIGFSAIKGSLATIISNIIEGRVSLDGGVTEDFINDLRQYFKSNDVDTLQGGQGDDTYVIVDSEDVIVELANEGRDTVIANLEGFQTPVNIEVLVLGEGIVTAVGSGQGEIVQGNSLANYLVSGNGNDILEGRGGNDTYVVNNSGDSVVEGQNEGLDQVVSSVSYTLIDNIENLKLTGATNISGTGNNQANVIVGGTGNNDLNGGGGADSLMGGAGDDTLFGGNDLDVDTLDGGRGNDTYLVTRLFADSSDIRDVINESIAESGGIDTILIPAVETQEPFVIPRGIENLRVSTSDSSIDIDGNLSSNEITGNSRANIISGKQGDDTLLGGGGNDFLFGDEGDDVLDGSNMYGGSGNDTYRFSDASQLIKDTGGDADNIEASISYDHDARVLAARTVGDIENITLTGTSAINASLDDSNNTLTGNEANNRLEGNGGNDTLVGNGGTDTLVGGAGTDSLVGGDGDDVYLVDELDTIVEAANGGSDTIFSLSDLNLGDFPNVENIDLSLSASTASSSATGNALSNSIVGSSGNNQISGLAGDDTLDGAGGNDSLLGGVGADILRGGTGNDSLEGGAGADTLEGGQGNDIYVVNIGDTVNESAGEGVDTVQASISVDLLSDFQNVENATLLDAAGAANLSGDDSNNVLTGNSSANILDGRGGVDTLVGGDGGDTYVVDNVANVVDESGTTGTDTVQSSVTYTLGNTLENLILTGSANINATGNANNNTLTGNSNNNVFQGAGGNDVFAGGAGDDTYNIETFDAVIEGREFRMIENQTLVGSIADLFSPSRSEVTYGLVGEDGHLFNVDENGLVTFVGSPDFENAGDENGDNVYELTPFTKIVVGNSRPTPGASFKVKVIDEVNEKLAISAGAGNERVTQLIVDGAGTQFALVEGSELFNVDIDGVIRFINAPQFVQGADPSIVKVSVTQNGVTNVVALGVSVAENAAGRVDVINRVKSVDVTPIEDVSNDTVRISNPTPTFPVTLSAEVENLVLVTTDAAILTGNARDNIITGNTGNDTLDGKEGADTLRGGAGDDSYTVDANDVIEEAIGAGTDVVNSALSYTLGDNFENLTLTGGDNVNATGNSAANTLRGNSGNNVLDGGGGVDSMLGGAGNDTYVVDNASDIVAEASRGNADTVQTSLNAFDLTTTSGRQNIENLTFTSANSNTGTGNALNNTLIGNSGNDTLDGGTGTDRLEGKAGDDTFTIDNANDVVVELAGGGTDIVNSSITRTLSDNVENLSLTGSANINATGNALANTLVGNTGNNRLQGLGGDDTIVYSVTDTNDTIEGGEGSDALNVSGSDVSFDLTAVTSLTGVEVINFTGTGAHTLKVDETSVNTVAGGTLKVFGESADKLLATGDWNLITNNQADANGVLFDIYQLASTATRLQVEDGVDVRVLDPQPTFSIDNLDGDNGFTIQGSADDDWVLFDFGSAGDINGDGFADLVIGLERAYSFKSDYYGYDYFGGRAFVVFGDDGLASSVSLATLDGSNGFTLDGYDDSLGASVASAGDINGDGIDDLLVGDPSAGDSLPSGYGNGREGISYVVFGENDEANGDSNFSARITASDLESSGTNDGFALTASGIGAKSGNSVTGIGDFNGDGIDDFIISGHYKTHTTDREGSVYVVFGSTDGLDGSIDLEGLDGTTGMEITGVNQTSSQLGSNVAAAGDINGDGFDDFLFGSYFVILGTDSGDASLDVDNLDGSNGFELYYGNDAVAGGGDINGDGFADLVIGHDEYGVFVLFGASDMSNVVSNLSYDDGYRSSGSLLALDPAYGGDGSLGFKINSDADDDGSIAGSIVMLGDVNGDGYDDFIVANERANYNDDTEQYAGEAYVVFGAATGHGGLLELTDLDGTNGFAVSGSDTSKLGQSVGNAGDINGDGFADIVVGEKGSEEYSAKAEDDVHQGSAYVIYGDDFAGDAGLVGTNGNDQLNAGGQDVVKAGSGDDTVTVSGVNFFRIDGGGGDDTLALDGAGLSLKFDDLQPRALTNFETIDLTGSGDNTLTISHLQAGDLLGAGLTLQVDGDSGDTVNLARGATKSVGASNTTYSNKNTVISVANTVTVVEQEFTPIFFNETSFDINENTTFVVDLLARDGNGDDITYGISGGKAASFFSINASTGELSFSSAPNFESPQGPLTFGVSNDYEVSVSATDSTGRVAIQNITATVVNVAEAPTISISVTAASAITTDLDNVFSLDDPSGQQAVSFMFNDEDGDLASLVLSGPDQGEGGFSIRSSTLFAPFGGPDANGDGVYELTLTATDDAGNETTQDLFIGTIAGTNGIPIFEDDTVTELTITEGDTAVETYSAFDVENQTITYGVSGADDGGLFSIDPSTGELSFTSAPSYVDDADAAGNTYRVNVTATDSAGGVGTVAVDVTVAYLLVDAADPDNPPVLANFTTDNAGEILDFSGLLSANGGPQDESAFSAGWLNFRSSGGAIVIEFDSDGGGDDYVEVVKILGAAGNLEETDSDGFIF